MHLWRTVSVDTLQLLVSQFVLECNLKAPDTSDEQAESQSIRFNFLLLFRVRFFFLSLSFSSEAVVSMPLVVQ